MTTPKRSPSPSFSADLCDHQEKRPKFEDESSTETVGSESQQATLADNALEEVKNTLPNLDKVIESAKEAHATPPVTPRKASPSEPDGFIPLSDSPAPQYQAIIDHTRGEDERGEPARVPRRDGRSPSPSGDTRIPLWWDETRAFKGEIIVSSRNKNKEGSAGKVARQAQRAPLVVDGKPQFNLFVDGSHQSGAYDHQTAERQMFARGGYGVVFRNPYHGQGVVEFDHGHGSEAWQSTRQALTLLSTQEDRLEIRDFNIRSWRSYRVYSSRHAEMAAVSQALETVIAVVKRQKPSSGVSVNIFTDSKDSLNRIARPPRPVSNDMTKSDALSMPLLRAIIWQSHYLSDEWDCEIKLRWLPRCCVLAHRLADHVAGWWKSGDKHESGDGAGVVFQQKDRPVWRRDGIVDALHEDLTKIVDRINKGEIKDPARPLPAPKLMLKMPPIWERNAAYSMVDEDMAKVLKGSPFKNE